MFWRRDIFPLENYEAYLTLLRCRRYVTSNYRHSNLRTPWSEMEFDGLSKFGIPFRRYLLRNIKRPNYCELDISDDDNYLAKRVKKRKNLSEDANNLEGEVILDVNRLKIARRRRYSESTAVTLRRGEELLDDVDHSLKPNSGKSKKRKSKKKCMSKSTSNLALCPFCNKPKANYKFRDNHLTPSPENDLNSTDENSENITTRVYHRRSSRAENLYVVSGGEESDMTRDEVRDASNERSRSAGTLQERNKVYENTDDDVASTHLQKETFGKQKDRDKLERPINMSRKRKSDSKIIYTNQNKERVNEYTKLKSSFTKQGIDNASHLRSTEEGQIETLSNYQRYDDLYENKGGEKTEANRRKSPNRNPKNIKCNENNGTKINVRNQLLDVEPKKVVHRRRSASARSLKTPEASLDLDGSKDQSKKKSEKIVSSKNAKIETAERKRAKSSEANIISGPSTAHPLNAEPQEIVYKHKSESVKDSRTLAKTSVDSQGSKDQSKRKSISSDRNRKSFTSTSQFDQTKDTELHEVEIIPNVGKRLCSRNVVKRTLEAKRTKSADGEVNKISSKRLDSGKAKKPIERNIPRITYSEINQGNDLPPCEDDVPAARVLYDNPNYIQHIIDSQNVTRTKRSAQTKLTSEKPKSGESNLDLVATKNKHEKSTSIRKPQNVKSTCGSEQHINPEPETTSSWKTTGGKIVKLFQGHNKTTDADSNNNFDEQPTNLFDRKLSNSEKSNGELNTNTVDIQRTILHENSYREATTKATSPNDIRNEAVYKLVDENSNVQAEENSNNKCHGKNKSEKRRKSRQLKSSVNKKKVCHCHRSKLHKPAANRLKSSTKAPLAKQRSNRPVITQRRRCNSEPSFPTYIENIEFDYIDYNIAQDPLDLVNNRNEAVLDLNEASTSRDNPRVSENIENSLSKEERIKRWKEMNRQQAGNSSPETQLRKLFNDERETEKSRRELIKILAASTEEFDDSDDSPRINLTPRSDAVPIQEVNSTDESIPCIEVVDITSSNPQECDDSPIALEIVERPRDAQPQSMTKMEHYKKRLIHQHEKPLLQFPYTTTEDEDNNASMSSISSSSSGPSNQNAVLDKKKEETIQLKVAKKRAVSRKQFRHQNLELFKLGTSIPTSLCKTKEPYNVCAEKNLQMCCQSQQNGKKDVNPMSITDSIINSMEGTKKRDPVLWRSVSLNETQRAINTDNNVREDAKKNVGSGRHILPAIVPEIPDRRKNKLSLTSKTGSEERNGCEENSKSGQNDVIKKADPISINQRKYITQRRKTIIGIESSSTNREILRESEGSTQFYEQETNSSSSLRSSPCIEVVGIQNSPINLSMSRPPQNDGVRMSENFYDPRPSTSGNRNHQRKQSVPRHVNGSHDFLNPILNGTTAVAQQQPMNYPPVNVPRRVNGVENVPALPQRRRSANYPTMNALQGSDNVPAMSQMHTAANYPPMLVSRQGPQNCSEAHGPSNFSHINPQRQVTCSGNVMTISQIHTPANYPPMNVPRQVNGSENILAMSQIHTSANYPPMNVQRQVNGRENNQVITQVQVHAPANFPPMNVQRQVNGSENILAMAQVHAPANYQPMNVQRQVNGPPTRKSRSHHQGNGFPEIQQQLIRMQTPNAPVPQENYDFLLRQDLLQLLPEEDNNEDIIKTIIQLVKSSMDPNFSLEILMILNKWFIELTEYLRLPYISNHIRTSIARTLEDVVCYVSHHIFHGQYNQHLQEHVKQMMGLFLQPHKNLLIDVLPVLKTAADKDTLIEMLVRLISHPPQRMSAERLANNGAINDAPGIVNLMPEQAYGQPQEAHDFVGPPHLLPGLMLPPEQYFVNQPRNLGPPPPYDAVHYTEPHRQNAEHNVMPRENPQRQGVYQNTRRARGKPRNGPPPSTVVRSEKPCLADNRCVAPKADSRAKPRRAKKSTPANKRLNVTNNIQPINNSNTSNGMNGSNPNKDPLPPPKGAKNKINIQSLEIIKPQSNPANLINGLQSTSSSQPKAPQKIKKRPKSKSCSPDVEELLHTNVIINKNVVTTTNDGSKDASEPKEKEKVPTLKKSTPNVGTNVNEKLVNEMPINEKPVSEKPVNEKPINEKPAANNGAQPVIDCDKADTNKDIPSTVIVQDNSMEITRSSTSQNTAPPKLVADEQKKNCNEIIVERIRYVRGCKRGESSSTLTLRRNGLAEEVDLNINMIQVVQRKVDSGGSEYVEAGADGSNANDVQEYLLCCKSLEAEKKVENAVPEVKMTNTTENGKDVYVEEVKPMSIPQSALPKMTNLVDEKGCRDPKPKSPKNDIEKRVAATKRKSNSAVIIEDEKKGECKSAKKSDGAKVSDCNQNYITENNQIPNGEAISNSGEIKTAVEVSLTPIPFEQLSDTNSVITTVDSPFQSPNEEFVALTPVIEDISSDEEPFEAFEQYNTYDSKLRCDPKLILENCALSLCTMIEGNMRHIEDSVRDRFQDKEPVYTKPVAPQHVIKNAGEIEKYPSNSIDNTYLCNMAKFETDGTSVTCSIDVRSHPLERGYSCRKRGKGVLQSRHCTENGRYSETPPGDSSSFPSNAKSNTPVPESPPVAPVRQIVPTFSPVNASPVHPEALRSNWKQFIGVEHRKGFFNFARSLSTDSGNDEQSIESTGSFDRRPSPSTDNTYYEIKVDSKLYTIKKNIYEKIPKGKLCFVRESNTLIRYFDDKQMELFMRNLNISEASLVAPDLFKHIKGRMDGMVDFEVSLGPYDTSRKSEIITLSRDVCFLADDFILDPEVYIEEMDKVKRYIPKDFFGFYKYVTGYQIINNHPPVSFQTFLTMHNTNGLRGLLKNYINTLAQGKNASCIPEEPVVEL